MFETLLLANPDIDTLRHQWSRASTSGPGIGTVSRTFAVLFPGGLATRFDEHTNLEGGCPRIARGEPWAGSITGGEARQNLRSEKEGFKHPSLWRAPCFWGTYE
jgi:hypothetical protein